MRSRAATTPRSRVAPASPRELLVGQHAGLDPRARFDDPVAVTRWIRVVVRRGTTSATASTGTLPVRPSTKMVRSFSIFEPFLRHEPQVHRDQVVALPERRQVVTREVRVERLASDALVTPATRACA